MMVLRSATAPLASLIGLAMLGSGVSASLAATPHRNVKIYEAVEANRAAALDLLARIVNIDSGTGDVEGGAKVEAVLAEQLKALGAELSSVSAEAPGLPDNLRAVFHGTGKGKILIVAHIDTVFGPGTAARRPFSIDGDRAHGPGPCWNAPGDGPAGGDLTSLGASGETIEVLVATTLVALSARYLKHAERHFPQPRSPIPFLRGPRLARGGRRRGPPCVEKHPQAWPSGRKGPGA